MQIFLVQSMDFPGQIRPIQTSAQPVSKLVLGELHFRGLIEALSFSGFPLAPLLDQLEFPTEEIV